MIIKKLIIINNKLWEIFTDGSGFIYSIIGKTYQKDKVSKKYIK